MEGMDWPKSLIASDEPGELYAKQGEEMVRYTSGDKAKDLLKWAEMANKSATNSQDEEKAQK